MCIACNNQRPQTLVQFPPNPISPPLPIILIITLINVEWSVCINKIINNKKEKCIGINFTPLLTFGWAYYIALNNQKPSNLFQFVPPSSSTKLENGASRLRNFKDESRIRDDPKSNIENAYEKFDTQTSGMLYNYRSNHTSNIPASFVGRSGVVCLLHVRARVRFKGPDLAVSNVLKGTSQDYRNRV